MAFPWGRPRAWSRPFDGAPLIWLRRNDPVVIDISACGNRPLAVDGVYGQKMVFSVPKRLAYC